MIPKYKHVKGGTPHTAHNKRVSLSIADMFHLKNIVKFQVEPYIYRNTQ